MEGLGKYTQDRNVMIPKLFKSVIRFCGLLKYLILHEDKNYNLEILNLNKLLNLHS